MELVFSERLESFGCPPTFYTDGSRLSAGDSGYAVFCERLGIAESIAANSLNSIFEVEALAILRAIAHIFEHNLGCALIVSDSLSVLSGLKTLDTKGNQHPVIYQIKQQLVVLSKRGIMVTMVWIPNHVGVLSNERADGLAYEAAVSVRDGLVEPAGRIYAPNLFILIRDISLLQAGAFFEETAVVKGYRYFNRAKLRRGSLVSDVSELTITLWQHFKVD